MSISVLDPVSSAYDRTRKVLFATGDFYKWICIWFCSWLSGLGSGGGVNLNFNIPTDFSKPGPGKAIPPEIEAFFESVKGWVLENLGLVIAAGVALVVFIIALKVVFCWISSRARFMFLDNVVMNRGEVVKPWHGFCSHGNSLFLFRLVYGIGVLILFAAIIVGCVMAFVPYVRAQTMDEAGLWMIVGAVVAVLTLLAVLWMIDVFLQDFVTPIMYLKGGGVMAAWGEFRGLLGEHMWPIVLYLHVKAALLLVVVMISIAIGCVLCCIACLPIVGPVALSVLLLPLSVFMRCYAIDFLAQFGSEYVPLLGPAAGPPGPPGPQTPVGLDVPVGPEIA